MLRETETQKNRNRTQETHPPTSQSPVCRMSEHCSGESRVPARAGGHAETKLFAYVNVGARAPWESLIRFYDTSVKSRTYGAARLALSSLPVNSADRGARMRSSSRRVPTGHPRAARPRTQRGQIELSGGRHGAAPRPLGPSGSTNDSTRGGRHVWARRRR